MNKSAKILSVFFNLANYGVGIAVAVILVFKLDFISVFYVNSMTSNQSLFFNLILFQVGLALASVVTSKLAAESYTKVVEFPTAFMLLPLAVAVIGIVYALGGETTAEKVFVIAASVIWLVLSGVIVYFGSRTFQMLEKSDDE